MFELSFISQRCIKNIPWICPRFINVNNYIQSYLRVQVNIDLITNMMYSPVIHKGFTKYVVLKRVRNFFLMWIKLYQRYVSYHYTAASSLLFMI